MTSVFGVSVYSCDCSSSSCPTIYIFLLYRSADVLCVIYYWTVCLMILIIIIIIIVIIYYPAHEGVFCLESVC